MSLDNIDQLPDVIADGQVGHEQDHVNIHSGLKALKSVVLDRMSVVDVLPQATEALQGNMVIVSDGQAKDKLYVCGFDGTEYSWMEIALT